MRKILRLWLIRVVGQSVTKEFGEKSTVKGEKSKSSGFDFDWLVLMEIIIGFIHIIVLI